MISDKDKFLPLSLEDLIQLDYDEYEQKKKKAAEESITSTSVEEDVGDGGGVVTTTTTTTTTTKVETVVVNKKAAAVAAAANTTIKLDTNSSPADLVVPDKHAPVDLSIVTEPPSINGTITPTAPNIDTNTPPDSNGVISNEGHARENALQRGYNYGDSTDTKKEEEKGKVVIPHDDSNSIYVGLRVYTHKDVPAVVVGRLKAIKKEVKAENVSSDVTSTNTSSSS